MRSSTHLVSAVVVDLRGLPEMGDADVLSAATDALNRFHETHRAHPAAILMTEGQLEQIERHSAIDIIAAGGGRLGSLWGHPIWVTR